MAQVKLSWQIEGLHDGIQVEVRSVDDSWGGIDAVGAIVAVLPEGTTEYTHDFLLSELEQHIIGNELVYIVSAFRGSDIRHGEPLTVRLVDSPIPELVGLGMGDTIDGLIEVGLPSIYIGSDQFVPERYGINVLVTDYNLDSEFDANNRAIGNLSESSQRKLASVDKTENSLNILRNAVALENIDISSLSESYLMSGKADIYLMSNENASDIIAGDSRYTPILNTLFSEMGSEGKVKILLDDFSIRMSGGDFNELALHSSVLVLDATDGNSFTIESIQLTGEMKQENYAMFFVQVFSEIMEA